MRNWHRLKSPFRSWHTSRGGSAFTSSVPLILTRSTAAWAQDKEGNLIAFGVDERRLTSAGLTITGAATRLHGEAPTNGGNLGATSLVLPVEGLFNPLRSISAGANWHRRVVPIFSITNAVPVFVRVRVRAGTSGLMRIACRNETAVTESIIIGSLASPSITSVSAGEITEIVNTLLLSGDREVTFTWTPNANGSGGQNGIGIGPGSTTSGEYIDIIGMQATSQFSEWIMGGAGTVAQAADVATLDLTGVSLAAGFMLRMDGTLLATPRINFDRFYQADTGVNDNRCAGLVAPSTGNWFATQAVASVSQADVQIAIAVTPPFAFSLVGAHGLNYVGGAVSGAVATPDTVATYTTPTVFRIGASSPGNATPPLLLTRITLFPETPTTPRVTAVAA